MTENNAQEACKLLADKDNDGVVTKQELCELDFANSTNGPYFHFEKISCFLALLQSSGFMNGSKRIKFRA